MRWVDLYRKYWRRFVAPETKSGDSELVFDVPGDAEIGSGAEPTPIATLRTPSSELQRFDPKRLCPKCSSEAPNWVYLGSTGLNRIRRDCPKCGYAWEESAHDYDADAEFLHQIEWNQGTNAILGMKDILDRDDPFYRELSERVRGKG